MTDNLYFEGDPATDSARRHLERVLKEPRRHRRWPWAVGALAAVGAWYVWPRRRAEQKPEEASGPAKTSS